MSVGRPSEYTEEKATAICTRLVEGESLRSICRDEAMPSLQTVFNWFAAHPPFVEQYARAREAQADTLADDILEISDDARNDWMERHGDDDGGWAVNGEHIQRSRLRVDSRKWIASKLKPKKYGEKVETTLRTEPGSPVEIAATLDPSEAMKRYLDMMASTG